MTASCFAQTAPDEQAVEGPHWVVQVPLGDPWISTQDRPLAQSAAELQGCPMASLANGPASGSVEAGQGAPHACVRRARPIDANATLMTRGVARVLPRASPDLTGAYAATWR